MSRFTKEARQEIVREFAVRHDGRFDPALFLKEVRDTGESHPAHGWFEWDQGKAAAAYQVEQARQFASDLRVVFTVEEVGGRKAVTVRQAAMPLVLSPMDGRKGGGGYFLVDPDDPAHMVEHCHQAAVALRGWINRYQAALLHAGGSVESVRDAVTALESVLPVQQIAAE